MHEQVQKQKNEVFQETKNKKKLTIKFTTRGEKEKKYKYKNNVFLFYKKKNLWEKTSKGDATCMKMKDNPFKKKTKKNKNTKAAFIFIKKQTKIITKKYIVL